jgi:hypothetical protein
VEWFAFNARDAPVRKEGQPATGLLDPSEVPEIALR